MISGGYSTGTVPNREKHTVATFVRTPSGKWKAVIRTLGWPTKCKTFRLKRDAMDWARRIEDQRMRDAFIERADGDTRPR